MRPFYLRATILYLLALTGVSDFCAGGQTDLGGLTAGNWTFFNGPEFPGAKGTLTQGKDDASGDALLIKGDFAQGGAYVAAGRTFPAPLNIKTLTFRACSSSGVIGLRINDKTGQCFQYTLRLPPNRWQELTLCEFGNPTRKDIRFWGGARDGVFHQPATGVMFLFSKPDAAAAKTSPAQSSAAAESPAAAGTGELLIASLRATVATGFAPQNVIASPGSDEAFTFRPDSAPDAADLHYTIRGYDGETVIREGAAAYDPATGLVQVAGGLPRGLYEITFAGGDQRLGLLSLEAFTLAPDPFFSIDCAFSVFSRFKDLTVLDRYLDILKRSGIGSFRDRYRWDAAEKEQGKFNVTGAFARDDATRDHARQRGLKILDVFHEPPLWLNHQGKEQLSPYPADLQAAVVCWPEMARRYQDVWSALEVWNEPELSFGATLPGDHLAALTKAISRTFSVNKLQTPLVGCVFAGYILMDKNSIRWYRSYVENGILDDCDIFSFHHYMPAEKTEAFVAAFRDLLQGSGREAMPFWITESGRPWPKGTQRAPLLPDKVSALDIAMKAVESRVCGVQTFFPFVMSYYDEKVSNFGMIDFLHSPMRSFAGYANCVRELSAKQYIGDLKIEGATICRVFAAAGGEAVAAVYTGGLATSELTLPKLEGLEVEGIDGRTLHPEGEKLRCQEGLIYLKAPRTLFEPLLVRATKAMELYTLAQTWRPQSRKALPVIFQPVTDVRSEVYTAWGYYYDTDKPCTRTIKVNNLSDEPVLVQLKTELPDGVEFVDPKPAQQLRLEPHTTVTAAFTMKTTKKMPGFRFTLSDSAGNATPLVQHMIAHDPVQVAAGPLQQNPSADLYALAAEGGWTDFSDAWSSDSQTEQKTPMTAKFKAEWEAGRLRVYVLVTDVKFYEPFAGWELWKGDSVQIGLHLPGVGGAQSFTELAAGKGTAGAQIFCHRSQSGKIEPGLLKNSTLEVTQEGESILYVLNLDAKELELGALSAEQVLGFSLLVNNNNGAGRLGYLHWGDGIGMVKNAVEFNELRMGK